jgi:acetyl-CoA carboxylase carboxyl transferase subunit beta
LPEPTWTATQVAAKKAVPDGLWTQCPECEETIFRKSLEANLMVCPKCDHHMRVSARQRIDQLLDPGTFEALDADMAPMDPLGFVDQKPYIDRLRDTQRKSGEIDGVQTGTGFIKGRKLVVGVMDFTFMAGSMGSVVGERLTRAIEHATDHSLPLVIVSCSGGARMQEGAVSLMQMPRTVIATRMVKEAGLPFITVLCDPTTGGVTASFAMLGDIQIAEPGALIGFAGARVIEQTVREKLPEGFQRAEYLLEHGILDMVVKRGEMRETLARVISLLREPLLERSDEEAEAAAPAE